MFGLLVLGLVLTSPFTPILLWVGCVSIARVLKGRAVGIGSIRDATRAGVVLLFVGMTIGGLAALLAALVTFVPFAVQRNRTDLFGLSMPAALASAAGASASFVALAVVAPLATASWLRLVSEADP